MDRREPTEVERYLLALAHQPESLPGAWPRHECGPDDARLIEQRRQAGGRWCARCPYPPPVARVHLLVGPSIFKPEAGRRWLDLCANCHVWLINGLAAIPDNAYGLNESRGRIDG